LHDFQVLNKELNHDAVMLYVLVNELLVITHLI